MQNNMNSIEVPVQLLDGEEQVEVEVVPEEDVDAVFVNKTFSGVPSVNVADGVVGGHGWMGGDV
jgi:hypothetical protein